ELHQAGFAGQAQHLRKEVGEGFAVELAEVADGAEIGAVVADKGQKGEVAFAGARDRAATQPPPRAWAGSDARDCSASADPRNSDRRVSPPGRRPEQRPV